MKFNVAGCARILLTSSFRSSKQFGLLGSFRWYLLVSHSLIFGEVRKQDSKKCPQNSSLCRRYEVWSEKYWS